MGYKWQPIADLDDDCTSLTDGELNSLLEVWKDVRGELEEQGVLPGFNQQLKRRWAIETGGIEGVYTLDRGITEVLIRRGIDASFIPHDKTDRNSELVAQIIQDQADVLEGLFAFVKGERDVSTSYIKELHAALLAHVDTAPVRDQLGNLMEVRVEKGAYKTLPNNPHRLDGEIHEYCPPEHVSAEMDRLLQLHREHVQKGVPVEIEAAWLHHRFTQIHPFTDGNGRVARALASLVFLKAGWFPLVITRDDLELYIDGLEIADQGNLRPFVDQFVRKQRSAFVEVLSVRDTVSPPESVEEAIAAMRQALVHRYEISEARFQKAISIAGSLRARAEGRLRQVAERVTSEVQPIQGSRFLVDTSFGHDHAKIISVAASLGYVANPSQFHAVATLAEHPKRTFSIVVSFHGTGRKFHGLLAVVTFVVHGDVATPVADVFQINYKESDEQAAQRFDPWLEKALIKALLKLPETLVTP